MVVGLKSSGFLVNTLFKYYVLGTGDMASAKAGSGLAFMFHGSWNLVRRDT